MKRFASVLLVSLLILSCVAAQADNAPTSQFGFKGWPYRQNNTHCLLGCSQCQSGQACGSCSYCQDAMATAQPAAPTQQPDQTPVPQPTARPTAQPTAHPTQLPTAAPTARPTAKPTGTPSASTGDYTTISVAAQEQKLLNLLNEDRAANGLSALNVDPELSRIARIKSCDMKENGYFAHTSPTYGNAAAMLTAFGYAYHGVGENIAHHATVEKSEAAFMSSSGHRQNILGSQWTKVGIGVCVDDNGFVYVTQLFVR